MIKNVLTKFASVSFLAGMFLYPPRLPRNRLRQLQALPLQEVQQKSNE